MTLLAALGTQWRQGPSGAYGLDYNAIPFVLRMKRIPRERWPDLFEDLRVLERAALLAMREQSDNDE